MSGWVKLHRKLLQWEWASDPKALAVFIRIILSANFQDSRWKGVDVKRGQLVFGREAFARECGISEQSLRTVIARLKSTSEITSQSTNRYTILTVVKYEEYQGEDFESTSQSTSQLTYKQPTNNQQSTTSKEYKKKKNIRNIPPIIPPEIPDWLPKLVWADFVEHRKSIKKKLTPKASELIIKKLEKWRHNHDIEEIITRSIEHGWAGVFEPNAQAVAKFDNQQSGQRMGQPSGGNRRKTWAEAGIELAEKYRLEAEAEERAARNNQQQGGKAVAFFGD